MLVPCNPKEANLRALQIKHASVVSDGLKFFPGVLVREFLLALHLGFRVVIGEQKSVEGLFDVGLVPATADLDIVSPFKYLQFVIDHVEDFICGEGLAFSVLWAFWIWLVTV
jgi:hypothetical protein